MNAFLIGLLGAILGLLLVVLLAWLWIKRKFKRFVDGLGKAFGGAGGVPPFRITLEPETNPEWTDRAAVDSVTGALTALGYVPAGDYLLPEMEGVKLRGLAHANDCTLAALYEHPQVPAPLLDLLRLHQDRHHVLVTTAPEDGMDKPPGKLTRRVEHDFSDGETVRDAIADMHRQILADSADRKPVPITARLFPTAFTAAYASEMDWRIGRGGVTPDEVRAAAAAGGQDVPDEDQVEMVQGVWRSAIDYFVGEEAQRAFLASATVSAADWETMRDRILVVHEHSVVTGLVESLASALHDAEDEDEDDEDESEDRYETLEREVRTAFGDANAMEGFEAARRAIPGLAAYEHLGDVDRPWHGSIYLRPESAE